MLQHDDLPAALTHKCRLGIQFHVTMFPNKQTEQLNYRLMMLFECDNWFDLFKCHFELLIVI